jgi:hypothetical protein
MVIILVLIIFLLIYYIFKLKEHFFGENIKSNTNNYYKYLLEDNKDKYSDYWDGNLKNVEELNLKKDIKFNITPFRTTDTFEILKNNYFERYNYNLKNKKVKNFKFNENLGVPKLSYLNVFNKEITTYDFHEFLKNITTNHNIKNIINVNLYDVNSKDTKPVTKIYSNKLYTYKNKNNKNILIDTEDLLLIHFKNDKYDKVINYSFIKNQIINLLNENLSNEYSSTNQKLNFIISQDRIITYKKNKYDEKEYYDFIIKIYSEHNSDSLIFQILCIYEPQSMNILILFLRYLGREIQSNHFFSYLLESIFDDSDENNIHCSLSDSKKCYQAGEKIKDIYPRNKYYCFDTDKNVDFNINKSNIDNKEDCEGIDGKNGIWDKICESNNECPFYKKNKNYTNEFGKCQSNGYCEFPLNMKNVSYTKPSKTQPLCYNCKPIYKNYNEPLDTKNYYKLNDNLEKCVGLDCHKCCEDQKNKSLYPELNGPDYAFHDDFVRRNQNENQLKNLKTTF